MPAAVVIPASQVDSKVLVVKKLIYYCFQFSIGHLYEYIQFAIYQI